MKIRKSPFFARLLEAQAIQHTREISGGENPQAVTTMKYPSDGDDITSPLPGIQKPGHLG